MEVLAACHLHSGWSYDGSWSLDALSDKFGRRGCQILLMTEHDRGFTGARFEEYRDACSRASSSNVLLVPGIEYSDAANRVHVLVWGVPFLGEGLPTKEMLTAVRAANGVAVLAHPSRKDAWQCLETEWTEMLLGIEVWNRKYDGWAPSKTAPRLMQTSTTIPFVGMDFHTIRQSFPLAMSLDIQGDCTEAQVLDSLRFGRCSPRAFGVPLTHHLLRKSMPALVVAERSRRSAASFMRFSKALKR
jgi:hypothetical protein